MSASAALTQSVTVFRELGWPGAAPADALTLPTGTPEQQRLAVSGLKSGEWGAFEAFDPTTYGWRSWLGDDINAGMLALFAIRMGVAARRAVAVLPGSGALSDELVTAVIASRGAEYAQSFVQHAARGGGRMWIDATSRFAGTTVRLVHQFELPVPAQLDYLRDWAVYALGAPANEGWLQPRDRGAIEPEVLAPRFREHAEIAVAAGLSVTGPFGLLVPAALERGWIDESAARELAFAGLDAAQRPGDRKVWAAFLTGPLGLTDAASRDELLARADALVSAIATGDAPLVEAFGPALIAHGDEQTLIEVLTLGLGVKTKKARRALLAAAAARPLPTKGVVADLAPLLTPIAESNDAPLSRAATAVLEAWQFSTPGEAAGSDDASGPGARSHGGAAALHGANAGPARAVGRGRWEATPPLWEVPRFSLGLTPGAGENTDALAAASTDATAAATTAAASELTGRPEGGPVDPDAEQLLALANELARRDPDLARTLLRGIRSQWVPGLRGVAEWVSGAELSGLDRPARTEFPGAKPTIYSPAPAREAAVMQRLGEVPVLLSTPTWIDMRIDPAEFTARLRAYAGAGAAASEADLLLALLRLDRELVTEAHREALAELTVPVVGQTGITLPLSAGEATLVYLADPLVEPELVLDTTRHWWRPEPLATPKSLAAFPARLKADGYGSDIELGVLPQGGDWTALAIGHSELSGHGLTLRQLARRATPLTPGQAINLIGAQRDLHERAKLDGALAITEAWQRGLLPPGIADVRKLDWMETPTKLAAFARSCLDLADEGMLSVVWPLLDELVVASLAAPRRLSGTAELVEAIGELLPAVHAAVGSGAAEADALTLPGVRALAAAGGSSRAVTLARAVVAQLPAVDDSAATAACDAAGDATARGSAAPAEAASAQAFAGEALGVVMGDAEFAEFWPSGSGEAAAVDDGARIRAAWHDPNASTKFLEIELELDPERLADPAPGPRTFRTRTSWFYDLESEGQCGMTEIRSAADEVDHASRSWLRWDAEAGAVRVADRRNWRGEGNGPLDRGGDTPPLTVGMVAVLLSGMNHDNGHGYHVLAAVRNDLIGAESVRLAVARLVASADFTPVKLAGMIEAEPDSLATLWPALTESVRAASTAKALPRWLNRVLDAALLRAPALAEAARRGRIPAAQAAWPGLAEIAGRKGTQAALRKARELSAALGL
ncbi:DUF6493 family protein [Leucobacter albus]|uniref:DUF6493 family protein n=1 Tax=Leucobacter albus TaxID=272210 RepID=A0ABW3TUF3_9MICO